MTKNELDEALAFINNPEGELQIIIYANIEGEAEPKRLDIKADDLPALRDIYVSALNSTIINQQNHTVINLSNADERGNCFYLYDLDIPDELNQLEEVIVNNDLDTFQFNDYELSQIESLITVLADNDNEVSMFKTLSPVEVIGRGGHIFWKANQRFEKFEDQLLRITGRFQVIRINENIIISDLKSVEKNFGFHDVITREATSCLETIAGLNLVQNMESLNELVTDISFARKLTRVARNSPVIKLSIPNVNIIAFSKIHPLTKNKMRYSEDDTQFNLDTKVSKDLLIKILNDDLLTSELTKLYYDSLAKDGVETEGENVEN